MPPRRAGQTLFAFCAARLLLFSDAVSDDDEKYQTTISPRLASRSRNRLGEFANNEIIFLETFALFFENLLTSRLFSQSAKARVWVVISRFIANFFESLGGVGTWGCSACVEIAFVSYRAGDS